MLTWMAPDAPLTAEQQTHVTACVTAARGATCSWTELRAEAWPAHTLLSPFGMLRVGVVNDVMRARMTCTRRDSMYVATVVTLPQHRGAGHARVLLEELVRRWGHVHLALEVRDDNVSARALYRRFAFVDEAGDTMARAPTSECGCAGCDAPANQVTARCGACRLVRYCGVEHQRKDWARHRTMCAAQPACVQRALHGVQLHWMSVSRGRGVVTTRATAAGAVLVDSAIAHTPPAGGADEVEQLVYKHRFAYQATPEERKRGVTDQGVLADAQARLRIEKREMYRMATRFAVREDATLGAWLKLLGSEHDARMADASDRVNACLARNVFIEVLPDGAQLCFRPLDAFFNHACLPNAAVGSTRVAATQALAAGAEVTISYTPQHVIAPFALRRGLIRRRMGFVCVCATCVAGATHPHEQRLQAGMARLEPAARARMESEFHALCGTPDAHEANLANIPMRLPLPWPEWRTRACAFVAEYFADARECSNWRRILVLRWLVVFAMDRAWYLGVRAYAQELLTAGTTLFEGDATCCAMSVVIELLADVMSREPQCAAAFARDARINAYLQRWRALV